MKNVNTMLSALLLVAALISPNSSTVTANATAANSCTYVGPWQANSATVNSPASFTELINTTNNSAKLMQAIRGTDNRIYTRTVSQVPLSEDVWSTWQEGNGITVKSEPDLIAYQATNTPGSGVFFMTAYGTDNGIYTRSSNNGTTWTAWTRGGDITLKAKPTTSVWGMLNASLGYYDAWKLVQTGYGSDNGLYTRTSLNGTTWTAWARGGAITLASSVEQVDYAGKLAQFARGTDNGLYSRYTTDGSVWTAWTRNSGGITVLDETTTTVGLFGSTGKLLQVVRGTDKGLYFRSSTNNTSWTDWARLGNLTAADKPTITTSRNSGCGTENVMRLYSRGTDNRLYGVENGGIDSADFGFSQGLNWSSDTGITLNNNISVVEFTPTFDAFGSIQSARGTDNRLYTRTITSGLAG